MDIDEINEVIKNLPNKKAPGKDEIKNKCLKTMPRTTRNTLVNLANAILKQKYFPETWKTARLIMIRKAGKPATDPSSYRPISLLSSVSKIIEKIIYRRFLNEVNEKKILPNHQFGFRKEHATTHQLLRLAESILEGFNKSELTGAVFLDVEKAIDRVWHDGLLYKMCRKNMSKRAIELTESYLTNRKFEVKLQQQPPPLGK